MTDQFVEHVFNVGRVMPRIVLWEIPVCCHDGSPLFAYEVGMTFGEDLVRLNMLQTTARTPALLYAFLQF